MRCGSCVVEMIDNLVLPPFHIIRLSSIVHIHIDIDESKHICVSKFINIYMNVEMLE